MSDTPLDELLGVRLAVEGDDERLELYRQLARYGKRRRRLAPTQPTPWLDRKLDELLDELLELRAPS